MRRLAATLAAVLASAGAASATGDITCSSADGEATVSMLVSRSDTLGILRTIVTVGDDTWSSDTSVAPGQPIMTGQAFENDGMLLVDFTAEPAGEIIGKLRAFAINEGEAYASGGVFAMTGKGAWIVDCSLRG